MGRYAPADRGGNRRIGLAVLMGVGLGLIAAMWHVRSTANTAGEEESLREIEEATQKLQELVAEAERKNRELSASVQAAQRRLTEKLKKEKGDSSVYGYSLNVGPVGTLVGPKSSQALVPASPDVNPKLAEVLARVAINKELIVGISNINIQDMLETWFTSLKRLGVKNFLVVALDEATRIFCENHGVPVYRQEARIAATQQGTGDNHAISSSKFHLIRDFLVLGYSVFLSDIDILFLQNPFEGGHLHRDVDVEGMTDGFTNDTAYGWDNKWDDPSMGLMRETHTMRIFVFNSGLFYIRPTKASLELLDRVADRLAKEKAWDQAVYNEEMFFPSQPSRNGLNIANRVLDYYDFMNSKTLFKEVRKSDKFKNHMPVSIHVNYHPDKYPRMLACVERYVNGKLNALDRFPDGSQ